MDELLDLNPVAGLAQTNVPIDYRSPSLRESIESEIVALENRLKAKRRALELLAKNPDTEELLTILGRGKY